MNILSAEFIGFTLIAVLVYYILPLRFRWLALLAASGVFYAFAGWQAAAYAAALCLVTWGGALGLGALRGRMKVLRDAERAADSPDPGPRRRAQLASRLLLALLLTAVFGGLCVFKYLPTALGWLGREALSLPAVLGLSYFTFQAAGYLIDCYWGKAEPAANPLRVLLFLLWFPQVTQGPISTWKQLSAQLTEGHPLDPDGFTAGFTLMLWGYFKKLVIADRLAPTTAALLGPSPVTGWVAALCALLYLIRLYADFSGAMDMMRGISRLFGITLPENFRQPLHSKTVAEFWRRWHITLGAWFRTYLLYPLTASRAGAAVSRLGSRLLGKKTGRQLPAALATVLIFLLIGVWHMATLNAVVYGLYFGLLMALSMLLEPLWKRLRQTLRLPEGGWFNAVRILRTLTLLWRAQFFAITASPGAGWQRLCSVAQPAGDGLAALTAMLAPLEWAIAGIALAIMLAVDIRCDVKPGLSDRLARRSILLRWPILLFLLFASLIFGAYGEGFDSTAFLYQGF